MTAAKSTRGVVLGCGIAGMLAAHVLSQYVDSVLVLDRDQLPDTPRTRSGAPQARHSHALMSRGATALDVVLPGTTRALVDAGARRVAMPQGTVIFSSSGWLRRVPGDQYFLACSRDLLEHVIRQRVSHGSRISTAESLDVIGLLGSARAVTGCRVRDRRNGEVRDITADFVVDATGRRSRSPQWLEALGLPPVSETVIDPGLAYATRHFQAPEPVREAFPTVIVMPGSAAGRPGRSGIVLPVEKGRWIVTLAGTRGVEPPVDEEGFIRFARSLAHPVLSDVITAADPLGSVRGFRNLANRRRNYHRMSHWPDGFIVIGDAFTTFNPVYAHGMSVAALQTVALRDGLSRHGLGSGTARRIQKAMARTTRMAWLAATAQDARRPLTTGRAPALTGLLSGFVDRLNRAATQQPAAARAVADLFTLSTSLTGLLSPGVLLAVLRAPRAGSPKAPPPFTRAESAGIGLGPDLLPLPSPPL